MSTNVLCVSAPKVRLLYWAEVLSRKFPHPPNNPVPRSMEAFKRRPVYSSLSYALDVAPANWTALNVSSPKTDPPVRLMGRQIGALLWDPVAGSITQFSLSCDMFCNGLVPLQDGRALIDSRHDTVRSFYGQPKVALFDPATNLLLWFFRFLSSRLQSVPVVVIRIYQSSRESWEQLTDGETL